MVFLYLFFNFFLFSLSEKLGIVNHQADQIDASNLVRVYGALLWNVGKARYDPMVLRLQLWKILKHIWRVRLRCWMFFFFFFFFFFFDIVCYCLLLSLWSTDPFFLVGWAVVSSSSTKLSSLQSPSLLNLWLLTLVPQWDSWCAWQRSVWLHGFSAGCCLRSVISGVWESKRISKRWTYWLPFNPWLIPPPSHFQVFQTPEVARVFVSSFWDEAYRFRDRVVFFGCSKRFLGVMEIAMILFQKMVY